MWCLNEEGDSSALDPLFLPRTCSFPSDFPIYLISIPKLSVPRGSRLLETKLGRPAGLQLPLSHISLLKNKQRKLALVWEKRKGNSLGGKKKWSLFQK